MIYLIAIFTMLPSLAWAEPNIPTVILTERLMMYSFALILGLEAWIFYKKLPNITKKKAFFLSLKSNLITMFLVVPLVWGIWLAIIMNINGIITPAGDSQFLIALLIRNDIITSIMRSPWIGDTESLLLAEWIMAPVYFIASYYFEYWFSRKSLKDFDNAQVKKAFFYANLYSYLMIMTFETIYQIIITPYKATNPYLF